MIFKKITKIIINNHPLINKDLHKYQISNKIKLKNKFLIWRIMLKISEKTKIL